MGDIRLRQWFVLFVLMALIAPATQAGDCAPSTSEPELDVTGGPAGRLYLDYDCLFLVHPDDCFSVWIYRESNGLDGLQRSDEIVDDTCNGMIVADEVLFP